jgi:hypothetical protein
VKRIIAIALLMLAAHAAPADARHHLTKRHAQSTGLRFVAPFVDLLDVDRTVPTRIVPPRECRRISHVTVRCRFTARLYTGRVVRSFVRVHRQRDGLLGFYTTLDVFRDGV